MCNKVQFIFFLLLFFIQYLHVNSGKVKIFDFSSENRWLYTYSIHSGLANQMFGIYSYLPLAIFMKSNVVIDDIYSRSSFEIMWPLPEDSWALVPFSSFFDWEFYESYWKGLGIQVVQERNFKNQSHLRLLNISRNPEFFPIPKAKLMKMLLDSNLQFPLPSNSIYSLNSKFGFVTLYKFWNDPSMLSLVHNSFKPAKFILQLYQIIINQLSSNYYSVHLRLEGDVWNLTSHIEYSRQIDKAFDHLILSKHFQSFRANESSRLFFLNPPQLYISSGIFSSTPFSRSLRMGFERLKETGFTHFTYHHKILDAYFKENNNGPIYSEYLNLKPEQFAYLDMLVIRNSKVFIDAHIPSTFSYLSQRFWFMDKGIYHKRKDIKFPLYGVSHEFHGWGL